MHQNSFGNGGSPPNSSWQQRQNQSALAKSQQIANFYANRPAMTNNPNTMPNGMPASFYLVQQGTTATTTTVYTNTVNGTSSGTYWSSSDDTPVVRSHADYARMALSALRQVNKVKLAADHALTLELPDGSKLELDDKGNHTLNDKDAKVVYKANRVREFNKFVNASDTLEQFVRYAKTLNISQDEFMALPIELFLKWLVLEAAKADGEDTDQWVTELNAHAEKIALSKLQQQLDNIAQRIDELDWKLSQRDKVPLLTYTQERGNNGETADREFRRQG